MNISCVSVGDLFGFIKSSKKNSNFEDFYLKFQRDLSICNCHCKKYLIKEATFLADSQKIKNIFGCFTSIAYLTMLFEKGPFSVIQKSLLEILLYGLNFG